MNPTRAFAPLLLGAALLFSVGCCKSDDKEIDKSRVGMYILKEEPDTFLELKADGTFRGGSGRYSNSGTYEIIGDTVKIKSAVGNSSIKIEGRDLVNDKGQHYVLKQ